VTQTLLQDPSVFPAGKSLENYENSISKGRKHAQQQRVVICGLARNLANILPHTLKQIEEIASLFADYRIVIYGNDSTDSTLDILYTFQKKNPKLHVISEKLGDPVNRSIRCLERTSRMARYRNRYREFVDKQFPDFDYALVMDMDLPGEVSCEGVAHTFGQDDWDFTGANGIIRKRGVFTEQLLHYDAWAFRRFGSFEAISTREVNHFFWRAGDPLVPVFSCFGGLGIYRMEAMKCCFYEGGDCEHVPLHRQMREKGLNRLFMNPSQITDYGVRYSRFIRNTRKLLRIETPSPLNT